MVSDTRVGWDGQDGMLYCILPDDHEHTGTHSCSTQRSHGRFILLQYSFLFSGLFGPPASGSGFLLRIPVAASDSGFWLRPSLLASGFRLSLRKRDFTSLRFLWVWLALGLPFFRVSLGVAQGFTSSGFFEFGMWVSLL